MTKKKFTVGLTELAADANAMRFQDAIDEVVAYLRKEFISDECRYGPTIGCMSCEAVDLEATLIKWRGQVRVMIPKEPS